MPRTDRGNDNEMSDIEGAKQARWEEIRKMTDPELMSVPLEELKSLPEVEVYYHEAKFHPGQQKIILQDPVLRGIIKIIDLREGRGPSADAEIHPW